MLSLIPQAYISFFSYTLYEQIIWTEDKYKNDKHCTMINLFPGCFNIYLQNISNYFLYL